MNGLLLWKNLIGGIATSKFAETIGTPAPYVIVIIDNTGVSMSHGDALRGNITDYLHGCLMDRCGGRYRFRYFGLFFWRSSGDGYSGAESTYDK